MCSIQEEIMTAAITVLVLTIVTLLIPCRYDPAIRWREWLEGWKDGKRASTNQKR